jgi:hypothetical protein
MNGTYYCSARPVTEAKELTLFDTVGWILITCTLFSVYSIANGTYAAVNYRSGSRVQFVSTDLDPARSKIRKLFATTIILILLFNIIFTPFIVSKSLAGTTGPV